MADLELFRNRLRVTGASVAKYLAEQSWGIFAMDVQGEIIFPAQGIPDTAVMWLWRTGWGDIPREVQTPPFGEVANYGREWCSTLVKFAGSTPVEDVLAMVRTASLNLLMEKKDVESDPEQAAS